MSTRQADLYTKTNNYNSYLRLRCSANTKSHQASQNQYPYKVWWKWTEYSKVTCEHWTQYQLLFKKENIKVSPWAFYQIWWVRTFRWLPDICSFQSLQNYTYNQKHKIARDCWILTSVKFHQMLFSVPEKKSKKWWWNQSEARMVILIFRSAKKKTQTW